MKAILRNPFRNKLEYPVVKNLFGFYILQVGREELPFSQYEIEQIISI